ncbi:MAG: adenosylcobinamide-phosphate synthase CbiB [Desulfofustis sp.]|nr:adenosylcobinamide-phosphate synthase CbiB [Desulfofustis sp.]
MSAEFTLYAQLLAILGLDLVVGDPRWFPHPVRFIGSLCSRFESLARTVLKAQPARLQGCFAWAGVISLSLLSVWLVLELLGMVSLHLSVAGALIVCFFCTAAGDLVKHSAKVRSDLRRGDINEARRSVAMMVGRDTAHLDEAEITRACMESVSENLVDGITAPLFWAMIAALAAPFLGVEGIISAAFGYIAYKAVNTMDSMYGYRNERYIQFGSCAARIDDVCNFLPARLSGLCVIAAALLPGYESRQAARVFFQDRLKSTSPNSAHTEAAVAGALGVRLGGPSSYFGEPTVKPYLGDGLRQAAPDDIPRTNRLVMVSAVLFYLSVFGLHWVVSGWLS